MTAGRVYGRIEAVSRDENSLMVRKKDVVILMSFIDDEDIVREIARRTRRNLDVIKAQADGQDEHDPKVYEVTQLINSLLGLIVFPNEEWVKKQPDEDLSVLFGQGWPNPVFLANKVNSSRLKDLVRYLRHSVAHCNVKFIPEDLGGGFCRIASVQLWNHPNGDKEKPIDFHVEMTVEQVEQFAYKLSDKVVAWAGPAQGSTLVEKLNKVR